MMSARFLAFNVVGLGGFAVQLGALWVLSGVSALPLATLLAVELALLHNFFWHQRWTWRDRPSGGIQETLARLVRFHAANGVVSLVGNVVITTALVQALGDVTGPSANGVTGPFANGTGTFASPVTGPFSDATGAFASPVTGPFSNGPYGVLVANLVATIACSLVNYVAGDRVVFRTFALAIALMTMTAVPARADQRPPAIAGWDKHVAAVERRFADPSSSFFAMDARKVERWRERARGGEVVMTEIDPPGIDDGKLHHWAGAIYVPKTTVDGLINKLLEYAGRESEFYQEVKRSKLLGRDGDRVRVYLRLFRDAGPVEATYNTEHAVEYRRLGTRATSRSVSTKIAELNHPGTPQEREKAPGQDNGFLWRLNAYWRYEQVGDGVLIECESVSLSRSVPFLLRPIANPIVDRIARESLRNTLSSLRTFLVR
jgi:putative flippase GtrA